MSSAAVCIPTYKRPELLSSLLSSLTTLRTDGISARVIVVDNDAFGSAESVAARFAVALPNLIYEVEPERGISTARNRLVAIAARVGVEYVVFVDDDERVDPAWLFNLIQTAEGCAADAVGGPVLPEFDDDVPMWIQNGGLFERQRHSTGTRLTLSAAGNLLVRRQWLERVEGPFDPRFDLRGGEDAYLLQSLSLLGASMVWCDEAVAYERVSASRGNLRWFLRRRFRIGTTWYRRQLPDLPQPLRLAAQTGRAAARLAYGTATVVPGLLRGRAGIARALGHCAMGVGGLLGLAGLSYSFYREVEGR